MNLLSQKEIYNLKILGFNIKIKSLKMTNAKYLINIYESYPKLEKLKINYVFIDLTILSYFQNLKDLNLSYTKIEDVSMLGNVHTLNLSHTDVTDVSMLGNVYNLDISYTKVKDVSMLGNIHILD